MHARSEDLISRMARLGELLLMHKRDRADVKRRTDTTPRKRKVISISGNPVPKKSKVIKIDPVTDSTQSTSLNKEKTPKRKSKTKIAPTVTPQPTPELIEKETKRRKITKSATKKLDAHKERIKKQRRERRITWKFEELAEPKRVEEPAPAPVKRKVQRKSTLKRLLAPKTQPEAPKPARKASPQPTRKQQLELSERLSSPKNTKEVKYSPKSEKRSAVDIKATVERLSGSPRSPKSPSPSKPRFPRKTAPKCESPLKVPEEIPVVEEPFEEEDSVSSVSPETHENSIAMNEAEKAEICNQMKENMTEYKATLVIDGDSEVNISADDLGLCELVAVATGTEEAVEEEEEGEEEQAVVQEEEEDTEEICIEEEEISSSTLLEKENDFEMPNFSSPIEYSNSSVDEAILNRDETSDDIGAQLSDGYCCSSTSDDVNYMAGP